MKNYSFRIVKPVEDGEFTECVGMANSIFLAGPCPREDYSEDWRYDAFDILEELGFNGVVVTPTNENFRDFERASKLGHLDMLKMQTDWERKMMHMATRLVFWIPRDKEHPARTTNVEFGEWYKKEGVFFGWPTWAEHNEYHQCKLMEQNKNFSDDLKTLLAEVVDSMGDTDDMFFTSDTHFSQQRTLELSRRPFVDVTEMDLEMISNWNKRVTMDDIVYHAGDFMDTDKIGDLTILLSNLNFKELHWTLGNYDRKVAEKIRETVAHSGRMVYFYDVGNPCRVEIGGRKFVVVHEPNDFAYDIKDDEIVLFGHIHGRAFAKRNGFDIATDYHRYSPLSSEQVSWFANAMKYWDENVYCGEVKKASE